MADPWQALGILPTASLEEAQRAYTLRVQLLHPDKHHGSSEEVLSEAHRWITELMEAWETVRTALAGTGEEDRYRTLVERDLAAMRGTATAAP